MGLARRVAKGALQRLAREVDRLAVALEPVRGAIPLRSAGEWVAELEVARWMSVGADASPSVAAPTSASVATSVADKPSPVTIEPEPTAGTPVVVAAALGSDPTAGSPPAVSPKSEATPVEPLAISLESEAGAERTPSVEPLPSLALAQVAHLRARLDPQLAALRHHAQWEQAEDPNEALRRTRVATRRLRAFTQLFAPMLGDKHARRLNRRLRAITRAIGPLREQCVLLEGLRAEHAHAEPLTQAALEHVIVWVERRREKAERRTRKALADVDAAALADALEAEVDRVCGTVLRVGDELPAKARTLLEPVLERAFDEMPQPVREEDVEAWHEVRKHAKHIRYAIELLRLTAGEDYGTLRRSAKRVQRALGYYHDRSLMITLLQHRREQLHATNLQTLSEAIESLEAVLLAQSRKRLSSARQSLTELTNWHDTVASTSERINPPDRTRRSTNPV